MNAIEYTKGYAERIRAELTNTLTNTSLSSGVKKTGKVRDQYDLGDKIALITTDRQSAFDRILASIPFKGQVLNQTSAWWFEKTKHIISNHVISIPDPNVTLAKKCVVKTIVDPFLFKALTTSQVSYRSSTSILAVGSSKKISLGS